MSLFAEMGNEIWHYLRMLLSRWIAKMSSFTKIQHILFGAKIHKCRDLRRSNTKSSVFAEMGNEICHYLRMILIRWNAKMSLFTEIQHILFGAKINKCRYLRRWNTKSSLFAEMGNEICHYLRMILSRWNAKMSLFTEIQHILFGAKIKKCRY